MKILKVFGKSAKKEKRILVDFYQASIEKVGREQIQKIVDRGLSLPIVTL